MFYANFVLAKKGPLARVWLAAHWEKKLSKAHVFETDLQSSVDNIISPKVKIALRTSGHLLLGVVRIYSRKAKYLLADCTEALIKIKMAFRPDVVDLPLDNQKAAVSAITLPELQEWDAMVNNLGSFDINTFNNNVCRVEDITMKEDLISSRFLNDDNFFGDTPFGEVSEKEILRDEGTFTEQDTVLGDLSKGLIQDEETPMKGDNTLQLSQSNLDLEMNDPMMGGSGFGAGEGLDFLEGFGMEEVSGVVDLDAGPKLNPLDDTVISKDNLEIDQIGPIDGMTSISGIDDISSIAAPPVQIEENESDDEDSQQLHSPGKKRLKSILKKKYSSDEANEEELEPKSAPTVNSETIETIQTFDVLPMKDTEMMTTLFSTDTEALNLEPIEEVVGKTKSKKRKRKLVVDQEKILLNDAIKQQINNDEDIIKTAVVAPPTKSRFVLLESSTRTCFTQPPIVPSKRKRLNELYEVNLTLEKPEDFVLPSSQEDDVQLEKVPEAEQKKHVEVPEVNEEAISTINEEEAEKPNEEEEEEEEFNYLDDQMPTPYNPTSPYNPDFDMDEIEEELQQEERLQIAPAFELDTIEKNTDLNELLEDDGLTVTYNEEEEEDDDDDDNVEIENNKRWTKRTHQTLRTLQKGLKKKQPIYFTDLTKKSNRKQAAYTFYTLLILRKEQAIDVQQSELFGSISIDRGAKFSATA